MSFMLTLGPGSLLRRGWGKVLKQWPKTLASERLWIDSAYFGLESGMVFDRTTGVYQRIYHSVPNDNWKERKI